MDFSSVVEYLTDWQLSVNSSKTELLHIGRINPGHPYVINQSEISPSIVCRDLGFLMSNDMSFGAHYSKLIRNSSFRLKQFRLSFLSKDRNFLIFLYTTYIRPILESGSVIWSPHYLQDIDRLENVQRNFTKYLAGLYNLSYQDRLTVLNLHSLESRRIYFDLIMTYKIINNLIDLNFDDFFAFSNSCTRGHSLKLNINYSRINCRKYFFSNRVVPIWNSLSEDIVTSRNLLAFKNKIYVFDVSAFCRGRAYTVQN